MNKKLFILIGSFFVGHAAMAQQAMDFSYDTQGQGPRPSVIFNDGTNTFIQPIAGTKMVITGAHQEGPYLTVAGTPNVITGTTNGMPIKITHQTAVASTPVVDIEDYDAQANSSAKLTLFKWAKKAGYELKADFEDYQIKKAISEKSFPDALLKLSLDNTRTQDLKSEFVGKTLILTEKNTQKTAAGAMPNGPLPNGVRPGMAGAPGTQAMIPAVEPKGLPEFKITPEQNISVALRSYLSTAGWKLSWDAVGEGKSKIRDFKLAEEFSMKPESVTDLVESLLRGRGVKVDVWTDDKRVVVSNPEKLEN